MEVKNKNKLVYFLFVYLRLFIEKMEKVAIDTVITKNRGMIGVSALKKILIAASNLDFYEHFNFQNVLIAHFQRQHFLCVSTQKHI